MTAVKTYKIRLKKGDKVIVRTGKYKGRTGRISATHPRLNKVTVEGINIAKKHVKPDQKHPQGDIIEITRPIFVSKVAYYDPEAKRASRLGSKLGPSGQKVRISKRTGKEIK